MLSPSSITKGLSRRLAGLARVLICFHIPCKHEYDHISQSISPFTCICVYSVSTLEYHHTCCIIIKVRPCKYLIVFAVNTALLHQCFIRTWNGKISFLPYLAKF